MGNSHSQGAALEPAELDKLSRSLVQLQKDDDEIPMPKNAYTPEQRKSQIYTPQQRRQQIRSQLLGSYEELQRTGATPPANSKLSLNTDMTRSQASIPDATTSSAASSQSELDKALAVIDHLRKSASPDQLAVLHQAFLSVTSQETNPSTPSEPQPMSPIAEEENQTRRMTRRRSLFSTPGAATREKSTKLMKRPLPKGKKAKTQTWSPEMFDTSPLSKIAGWESQNDGRAEVARSATPDFNGSYLGTHKIGSLHITNGAVSPEPSIYEMRPQTTESTTSLKPENYYTASEGSGRTSPDKCLSHEQPSIAVEELSVPADDGRSRSIPEVQIHAADIDDSFTSSDEVAFSTESASEQQQAPPRPPTAIGMYLVEASSNPYLPEPGDRAATIAGDENTARPAGDHVDMAGGERDSGFHDMDDRSPSERSDVYDGHTHRDEEHPKALHRAATLRHLGDDDGLKPGTLSTSSSVYSTIPRDRSAEESIGNSQGRPKTDSGYTSQDSVSTVDERESPDLDDTVLPTSHAAMENAHSASHLPAHPSRPALDNDEHARTPRPRPPIPNTTNLMVTEAQPAPTTPENSKRAFATSEPSQAPDGLISPLEKPTSQPKAGPKKLQKRRPLSERYNSAPLIVQTAASDLTDFSTLPSIPSDVVSRYSHRLSKHPDMEHLERTYKSVSHSNSKESLLSKFMEPINITFPSPSRSPEPETSQDRGRLSTQPEGEKHRFSWSRSKSRKRRSTERSTSRRRSGEEIPISVADFGTVAASLGSSPYDFAMATSRPPRRSEEALPEAKKMMHPHQLGAAPRKRIGMNDEQASNFALQRSRDRLENMDPRDAQRMERHRRLIHRSHSNGMGSQRPRPHSYHAPTELEKKSSYLAHASHQAIEDTNPAASDPRGRIDSFEGLTAHYTFDTSPGEQWDQANARPQRNDQNQNESADEAEDYFSSTQANGDDHSDNQSRHTAADQAMLSPGHAMPDHANSARIKEANSLDGQTGSRALEPSSCAVDNGISEWEKSARTWRQRRKSIGEGLRPAHAHEETQSPVTNPAIETPLPSATPPIRKGSEDQHPLHLETSAQHTRGPKATSPGPSVLQRAAAYEQFAGEQRAGSPGSRSASPSKLSHLGYFTQSPTSIYGEVRPGRWNGRLDGS